MPTSSTLALQEFLDDEDEELRRIAMATTGSWERGDQALVTALRTVLGRGIDLEDRPPLLAAVRRELCQVLLEGPDSPAVDAATGDNTVADGTTRAATTGGAQDAPARLATALDRLPARSRLLVTLAHLAHLTPFEIGQALGTDPASASTELEQARRELADSLARQGDELVLPDAPVRREVSFSREEGEMR